MTLPRLTQREVLAAGLFPLFFTSVPALQSLMDGVTTSKRLYFYAACALLFLVLSALLVFRKREITLEFNALDFALIALWLWALVRAAFTQYLVWHDDGVITITLLLFVYLVMRNVIAAEQRAGGTRVFSILAVGLMAGALIQSAYGMLQLYGLDPFPTKNYFKLIGSFGNPDALAGYLASIMPFALGMYLLIPAENAQLKHVRTMGLITFCATMLVLPATMIRGAWLGAGVGSLFIVWVKYDLTQRLRQLLSTRIRRFAATVLVLASVAGGGYGLYTLKPDSADGRLLIWKITLNMINDHPLWGIGFDRFAVEYGHYQAAYFASGNGTPREEYLAGNVHHAHNEVLQLMTELGALGVVAFLSIVLIALRLCLKSSGVALASWGGFAAMLVVALFSFPLHNLPLALAVCFLLSCLTSMNLAGKFSLLQARFSRQWQLGVCLLVTLLGVTSADHCLAGYSSHKAWQLAFIETQTNEWEIAKNRYLALEKTTVVNGKLSFMSGGLYGIMGYPDRALRLLRDSRKRYTDPHLFITLGKVFEAVGSIDSARRSYQLASTMQPNLLLPRYLLANSLLQAGQIREAGAVAEELLRQRIKIESVAANRIRNEMQQLVLLLHTQGSPQIPTMYQPERR